MEKFNVTELTQNELKSYTGGFLWAPFIVWAACDIISNWSTYKEAYREGYNHVRKQQ